MLLLKEQMSGLTAVQGVDSGRYSHLELAGFLERRRTAPDLDIPELWRRWRAA